MKALAFVALAVFSAAGLGGLPHMPTVPTSPPSPTATASPSPDVSDEAPLSVTSPADGERLVSRLPRFTGSAPLEATVVFDVAGEERARDVVDPAGHFSVVVPFTLRDEARKDVRVRALVGDLEVGSVDLSVVLPPSFVVVTPAQNAVTSSRHVLVSGTAVPDSDISLRVASGQASGAMTIPVSDVGEWVTTLTFTDDADARQSVTVQQLVSGEHRGEFTLQFILPNAAPSTPTPDHGATPPATSPSLPETGGDVIPILLLSLAAMIAGGFLIARRRTARGR